MGQKARHANRNARKLARAAGTSLKTGPMIKSSTAAGLVNGTFVSYSSNWAGGAITSTDVTEVTATATVPSVRSGDGAAWVGIDGDSCETAILQTGFEWIDGSYDAWYEWYPADSVSFDLDVNEGDSIKMTVKATSKSGGSATIDNLTTGESKTKTFSGESDKLCEYDAEWIVEDFEECDGDSCSLVPFGDFGTVEFTDATATIGGSTVEAGESSILDIESDEGDILTHCTASGSTVSCRYE
jgi:hypothetical protein